MTFGERLREIAKRIEPAAGHEDALFEARQILCSVAGVKSSDPVTLTEQTLSDGQLKELEDRIRRRLSREPLQYILGEWEFMGLPFLTEPSSLIPRQDTETLCEEAVQRIRSEEYSSVLDMCCGSGCIGISVAKLTGVAVTLADINEGCLDLSRKNAERNGVEAAFVLTDLFGSLNGKRFDLILCNPPYLTREEMENLQREMCFEPWEALFGGEDGLDYYRRIAREYSEHLNPGGAMLLEIGCSQWDGVKGLFRDPDLIYDLSGHPRVAVVCANDIDRIRREDVREA